jgi:hypothetical protein
MMEHPRPGMPGTGKLAPQGLRQAAPRRIAVMAPEDAPGLLALRERLHAWPELNAEHHATGFRTPESAALPEIVDRILERHRKQPYDAILLLDGREDALGIAESTQLIPEQLRRMPVPVWSAIGEDDANTEIGDVAARTFSSPSALLAALQRWLSGNGVGAVAPADSTTVQWLPVPVASAQPAGDEAAPARQRTHPLVLGAAVAVIMASMTAIAAMLGVLPDLGHPAPAPGESRPQPAAALARQPATSVVANPSKPGPGPVISTTATLGSAPAVATPAAATTAPHVAVPTAAAPTRPVVENEAAPASAAPAQPAAAPVEPIPSTSSPAEPEQPKAAAAGPPAPRKQLARRSPRRKPKPEMLAYAQAPVHRVPGSEEVPSFNFVGTKTRAQVIAEMIAARRQEKRNGNAGTSETPQSHPRSKP